jgi:hypothetical protein
VLCFQTREESSYLEKLVDWSRAGEHNGKASVNTDQALLNFAHWVKHNHRSYTFDHAMLFSG